MDDVRFGERCDRRHQLQTEIDHSRRLERTLRDQRGELDAVDVLHDQIGRAVRKLARFEDRHDVAMSHASTDERLAAKARAAPRVETRTALHHFERNAVTEIDVLRLVDDSMTADAEHRSDAESIDDFTRAQERRGHDLARIEHRRIVFRRGRENV
jgi:hypothetical protein